MRTQAIAGPTAAAVVLVMLGALLTPAQAAYPERPVRVIVGLAPGGGTDTIARIFAERLRTSLGQTVVVENTTGAAGTIGTGTRYLMYVPTARGRQLQAGRGGTQESRTASFECACARIQTHIHAPTFVFFSSAPHTFTYTHYICTYMHVLHS